MTPLAARAPEAHACQEQLQELMQFVYAMPVAILKLGPSAEVQMLNPMATQLLQRIGLDPASLGGPALMDALSGGLSALWSRSAATVGSLLAPRRSSFHVADGSTVHLVLRVVKPDPHCTMIAIEDVSATVEQERLLHQHRQWLGLVLEQIEGYCVAMVDADGRLLAPNPSIDRMFGVNSAHGVGQGLFELFGPAPAGGGPASFAGIKTALLERSSLRIEIPLRHQSGKLIPSDVLVAPTLAEDGTIGGYVFVIRDASAEHDTKDRLLKDAQTDHLTGLFNRRGLESRIGDQAPRPSSAAAAACWIMMDIDHFKRINDSYGHSTGDDVLKQIATVLKNSARKGDILARVGGEEFLIMLPRVSLATALAAAERLRSQIEQMELMSGPHRIRVTASFGVAEQPDGGRWVETVAIADEALLNAKASGRNRSVAAGN